jgi:16S rRNA (cytosine1402-N4)-methyltransferase
VSEATVRVLTDMNLQDETHIPVMLEEATAALAIRAGGTYLDGTFGRGGHARAILAQLGPHGRLLLMDRDPSAVAAARREFANDARVAIRHGNFADL